MIGYNNAYFYNGYIDEVRITKGIARYTATFNPDTAPFQDTPISVNTSYDPFWSDTVLLVRGGTDGSTTFTDDTGKTLGASSATNSVTNSLFGTGSIKFTNKTDYVQLPTSKDFDLVGDFTVEAWVTRGVARYASNFTPVRLPFPTGKLDGGSFDPYVKSVVLHSHFEGANGSTSIVDAATGKTPTLTGSPTISTADAKFGSSALRLTNGQHITYGSSADFNIGSGDFTVEMYIKLVAFPSSIDGMLFSFDGASTYNPQLFIWSDGNIYLRSAQSSGNIITPTAHGMSLNTWYHVALVKRNNLYSVMINGVTIAYGVSAAAANEVKSTAHRWFPIQWLHR